MVTKDDLYVTVLSYDTKAAIGPFSRNKLSERGLIGPERFVVFTEQRARDTAKEWNQMYGTPQKQALVMTLDEFLNQDAPVPVVA